MLIIDIINKNTRYKRVNMANNITNGKNLLLL